MHKEKKGEGKGVREKLVVKKTVEIGIVKCLSIYETDEVMRPGSYKIIVVIVYIIHKLSF